MDVILNHSSGEPLYEQIVQQIKRLIQTEQLREGDALPSMRLLAKELTRGRSRSARSRTAGWRATCGRRRPLPGRLASTSRSCWRGFPSAMRRSNKWRIASKIY